MNVRFNAKYTQINELFIEGWSIEGLKKVVWPRKAKGDKVAFNNPSENFRAEAFSTSHGFPFREAKTEEAEITQPTERR